MSSSRSDVRPGSNVKTCVKKRTHTTVDHSLASVWVYSIITSLCRPDLIQSWRVGVELLISPTTSAYSTVFTCFAILLKCKALQGEITFNQSWFPAASGTRVYISQSWWTRTQMCDFEWVKSQVLRPWIVPSSQPSIKSGNVRKHTRCLSLLVRNSSKLDFFYIINELIF